jgi:hypothetical protein
MAKGDVVNGISSIASGASLTFQPASGVECMITMAGSASMATGTPEIRVGTTDGTLTSYCNVQAGSAVPSTFGQLRIFINNSHYLTIKNENAGTSAIGYSGIQIK